jgi:hypothetical protein
MIRGWWDAVRQQQDDGHHSADGRGKTDGIPGLWMIGRPVAAVQTDHLVEPEIRPAPAIWIIPLCAVLL